MNNFRKDVNGLCAAFAIACESDDLAARLRISLTSTSSEGLILEALIGGYLKRTKKLLLLKLILFSLKTAIGLALGFWFKVFAGIWSTKARLKKLLN